MHAIVTGGAGHIGSHLVEALVARGDRVTVVDDLSTGRIAHLGAVRSEVALEVGDVRDERLLSRVVPGADVVFHLAAAVGVPHVLADPAGAVGTNLDGTGSVVGACAHHGVRLVFASTSEVYGATPTLPMAEDDPLVIGPPTAPRWSYALAKALGEHLVLEAGRHGLPVTVLRYFNSYGPRASLGGDGSVVARFVRQALRGGPITVHGDGSQVRCFTHVTDVARATLLAGTVGATVGQVCNVGSDEPVTMAALAEEISRRCGGVPVSHVDPRDRFGPDFAETRVRIPAVGRIRALTGWRPQVGFDEGLAATIAWCSGPDSSARQSA